MRIMLIFGPPALCLLITAFFIRRNIKRKTLTANRFAIIFSSGLSLSILLLFFLDLVVIGLRVDLGLIILGLGIGLINLLFGFPVSYFAYKYILKEKLINP